MLAVTVSYLQPATRGADAQPGLLKSESIYDTGRYAQNHATTITETPAGLVSAKLPVPFNTEQAPGGPMPAEETARTMELPRGFKCQVFAAEPNVRQPIAMAGDALGRLWIAECYTLAENPTRWNTDLRDRILIFEDTDNASSNSRTGARSPA
jgi:hypothetical protein